MFDCPVIDNHFGLFTVDWNTPDPVIKMEIYDIRNNQRLEYSIPLSVI